MEHGILGVSQKTIVGLTTTGNWTKNQNDNEKGKQYAPKYLLLVILSFQPFKWRTIA